MIAKLHIFSLVTALGGNGNDDDDCKRVLDAVPPTGSSVFLIETQSEPRQFDGEQQTRVFTAKMAGIEAHDHVRSVIVLADDLHEMRMVAGKVVIEEKPHNGYTSGFVTDRIGHYTSGSSNIMRLVVLYEQTPQNTFLVARLLRHKSIIDERDAKIASLKQALAQCAVPDTVRQLASALTPAMVSELLELAHRSTKPAPEQG